MTRAEFLKTKLHTHVEMITIIIVGYILIMIYYRRPNCNNISNDNDIR